MELIAQGELPHQRWRRRLPESTPIQLGRTVRGWATPWDEQISRQHVQLTLCGQSLEIQPLVSARNPVFIDGQVIQSAVLQPGEHFVIGRTSFTLSNSQVMATLDQPRPVTEQHYSAAYLRGVRYRDADQRIDALSQLPDLIKNAASDVELYSSVVNVLLLGVPRSHAAAVVQFHNGTLSEQVDVLHWDSRGRIDSDFRPSERLIRQAVQQDESTIHFWSERGGIDPAAYTQRDDMDWAFCTPVAGNSSTGWALYLAGSFNDPAATQSNQHSDFRDDLKFTESAAAMFGNLRDVKRLERRDAALSQFFSPAVLEVLAERDPEVVLAPRAADISVLFCDLRGFSLHAERSADDLFGLLEQVSDALGVMTRSILENGGVVGDFQGDSVMGFWGWPLSQHDGALQACRTAVKISGEFDRAQQVAGHPLAPFGCGIGIATGTAVAGKIGTVDQFKVTVFGPVVNLASRLEGMTKLWKTPILIDAATDEMIRPHLDGWDASLQRLGMVQPAGLRQTVSVSQLLPTQPSGPPNSAEQVAKMDGFIAAFQAGDWPAARQLLIRLPTTGFREFLLDFMAQHQGRCPQDWDGVIRLRSK